jgi:hypothetical protein
LTKAEPKSPLAAGGYFDKVSVISNGKGFGMAFDFQVVIDAQDPHALAPFWAEALGYVVEDNSPLIEQLLAAAAVPEQATVQVGGRRAWATLAAVRHPDDPYDEVSGGGRGRRILLQKVPEKKAGKNRVHLDLRVGADNLESEAARLEALGANVIARVEEQGGKWITLADPEGNEFDLT